MTFWRTLLGVPERDTSPAGDTETVRRIVGELDNLPTEQAAYVAAFAYILSRVARADMKVSEAETREMERVVVAHGGLPESQAILVVQMAKTQNRLFGATENWLVTQEFGRMADRERKLALLDCLFAVSAADDDVSNVENQVIRQIADELLLDHADFIAVRSRYRDRLSVLKDPESSES